MRMLSAADVPVAQRRDDLVYHYTSTAGFAAILTSKALHAAHVAHLNDTSEGSYALERCLQLLEEMVETVDMATAQGMARRYANAGGYVASASKDPDLLNQWQHYGSRGVALGLDASVALLPLGALDSDDAPRWQGVTYGASDLRAALWHRLTNGASPQEGERVSLHGLFAEEGHRSHGTGLKGVLLPLAFHTKHPGFEAEAEMRLFVETARDVQVKVDATGRLVTYTPLAAVGGGLPIREVVCGPGPVAQQLQAATAVTRLLELQEVEGPYTVTRSDIPFVPTR